MTATPVSPTLHEAHTLVADLRQQLDKVSLITLKQSLARIEDLLQQAQAADPAPPPANAAATVSASAEAADVIAVRQQMEAMRDQMATFTSHMVHEIRKPMTSIRGYADMLAKPGMMGTLNPMQQQFADTIRINVIKMEGLVTDISDLNKISAGRMKLDNKMTTFGQIMILVQKQADALNADYGHTLTWDVPQGLPILNADTTQVAKVIFKLVGNAIQYTPKPGAITLKAEAVGGNRLRVSVTDTGIGMSADQLARLGEPFFRGDHELVTSTKGYGLGIPVALGFLNLMEGTLEYASEPERGSTFSFTLQGMG
jgi:two-component system cell cycle sensor histidine kinase PleC